MWRSGCGINPRIRPVRSVSAAIPSSVRQGWDGDPVGVERVLAAWHTAVEAESGRPFDLDAYLDPHSDGEGEEDEIPARLEDIGPIEAAFQGLVNLAATIYRNGLTNPITVAAIENAYRLETGERRWLAYHLLYANSKNEKWAKIPARVVDASNVWRQAAENNARDNLNVIAKARQFAILLMDLLSRESEASFQFQPFHTFENERAYYAQVADGREHPIPDGRMELFLSVMGLKNPVQLRQIRKALRLPDEIWRTADDENWTEGRLRKYIPNTDGVTNVTRKSPLPQSDLPNALATLITKNREQYTKLIEKAHKLDENGQLQLYQIIEDEIAHLEQLKRRLREQRR